MRWHHGHPAAVWWCSRSFVQNSYHIDRSTKKQTPIAIYNTYNVYSIYRYKVNQISVKNLTCKNKIKHTLKAPSQQSEYPRHVWHRVAEHACIVRRTKSITHYTRLFSLYLYVIILYIMFSQHSSCSESRNVQNHISVYPLTDTHLYIYIILYTSHIYHILYI
jgi:hypothetical protein